LSLALFKDMTFGSPPVELGRGATSCVYLGEWMSMPVAVKVLTCASDRDAIARELQIVHELRHPNIIQVLGVCHDMQLFGTDLTKLPGWNCTGSPNPFGSLSWS